MTRLLPYARHTVDDEDIAAVVEILRSDWLTTGPVVERFESAIVDTCGAPYAVAVSSGTAALHAAVVAAGVGAGDEVIVPAITFAATANCVVFQGGRPVFADVDPETLLIDPREVERLLTPRTKAIIAVDYAGQPCDYDWLRTIARDRRVLLIADACHALGAQYRGTPVGTLADATAFSFHPAKHITTGEGGMVTTGRADWAERMRRFRNHGLSSPARERAAARSYAYEIVDLGFNYRLTDFQCALGLSQLRRLQASLERRHQIADRYRRAFAKRDGVVPLAERENCTHAYHLFVVRILSERYGCSRDQIFEALAADGIRANVHYLPVHLHAFYQHEFGTHKGLCPIAEALYSEILSLPMFAGMTDDDIQRVVDAFARHTTASASSIGE